MKTHHIFFGSAGLYVVLVFVLLLFTDNCACNWACRLFGVEEKSELTKFLGFLGAAGISLYLAWVSTRRVAAMDDTAKALGETAKASLKTSEASLKTASNNVLSGSRERFSRGLSHFGSKQGSRRIGGAHEMFLSSFEDGMEGHRAAVAGAVCMRIRDETSSKRYKKENRLSPSPEIRRLLELMFVGGNDEQRKNVEDFWKGMRADLSGSHLAGCDLEGANFKEARLERVCFNRAKTAAGPLLRGKAPGIILCRLHIGRGGVHGGGYKECPLLGGRTDGRPLPGINSRQS